MKMTQLNKFCKMLRERSVENNNSFQVLFRNQLYGNCFSILRQELDSMVRVIYLLNISDLTKRELLIKKTLDGEKWSFVNHNGKNQTVTDRDMVNVANELKGWTQNVYKFGCAFIHLSNFHNYLSEDPFKSLPDSEKDDIINQMRNYHFANLNRESTLNDIIPYLPSVMDKIKGNFECEIKSLERNENKSA